MDFSKLFTRLSAVEDVRRDAQTSFAPRNWCENEKRGKSRKRKPRGEQIGSSNKKQCFQAQVDTIKVDSFKRNHHHEWNAESVHASGGLSKEVTHYQGSYRTTYHQGQNYTAKDKHNVSKPQQLRKKMGRQNNQPQMKNAWKNDQTRKGNRKNYRCKWDARVKPTRFMSQEFKDQNALEIDGQLVCRHFLLGKCIKENECQLKHIQGSNDLIKESCKFYIQGYCSKGESCPYMHKSFPCKFFHRKGKCSQGPDCRFSHEPLNDFTTQLLDEALKRERESYELMKKAEQGSSGKEVTTEEPEVTPANNPLDVQIQTIRPSFYNSELTNAPQEDLLCQVEEQFNDVQEAAPARPSDQRPQSAESNNQEPVCYSVEAVLGRPLFKPFPRFFMPQSQESSSLSAEKCSPDSANQNEVPYSVDAVLRSCKSAQVSNFRPAAQTASKSHFAQITDSLLSPEPRSKKILCSTSSKTEETNAQGKLFNSLPSHKTCLDLTRESSELKKDGEIHDVKLDLLRSPAVVSEKSIKGITYFRNCKSEGCNCKSPTCSKQHTLLKSHVSGRTSNPEAPAKDPSPPGFSEFKGKTAVSAKQVTCPARTPDSVNSMKLPKIHPHLDGTEQSLNESSAADCSSNRKHCCNEPLKRSFQSLFASLITDSPKATPRSVVTPASCSTAQAENSTSTDKHERPAVEPRKTSTRSFLNLFASSLSAAPISQPRYSSTTSSDKPTTNASNPSDSNQSASKLETSLPCQNKSDATHTSHWSPSSKLSMNPKNEKEEGLWKGMKPEMNPACSLVSHSLSTFPSPPPRVNDPDLIVAEQRPGLPSHKSSAAAAAPPDSVLKTLFLHLSPYQQDGQQLDIIHICVPTEGEKDKTSMGGVVEAKQKNTSELKAQEPQNHNCEKAAAPSTEHQTSRGGSTLSSPAVTKPQLRNFGTHTPPLTAAMPPIQNSTQSGLKLITKEGKWLNRNVAAAPLKDLFKSFNTVHQFGH